MNAACLKEAVRILSRRERGSEELKQKLNAKGFGPDDVDPVLEFLTSRRYVDDQNAINETIAAKSGKRAVGRNLLRETLLERGFPEELVEASLPEAEAEAERAQAALDGNPKPDGVRAARFLLSRGFDPDTVESLIADRFGSMGD